MGITFSAGGPQLRIIVEGDCTAGLAAEDEARLMEAAKSRPVVVDFAAMTRINSVGLRSLARLCTDLSTLTPLRYERCVTQILEHFVLLPDFLRAGHVASVYRWESCPAGHLQEANFSNLGGSSAGISAGSAVAPSAGVARKGREVFIDPVVSAPKNQAHKGPEHCRVCGLELQDDEADHALAEILKVTSKGSAGRTP